jgi:hypothetical protein
VLRVGRVSVIGNSLYTSARWWRDGGKVVAARWWRGGGGEVVAFRRQNQVRQLKDTWPLGFSVSINVSSLLS